MGKERETTLSELAQRSDDLDMLKCLRIGLARQLEETDSGRDMAALSKQFMDVTREIREIEKTRPKKDRRTALDVARNKRKKRTAGKPKPAD